MKFSEFFNSWLNEGYYKKGIKVGKEGDFFTSVSVGSLFGVIISRYILKLCNEFKGKISLIEIGANEGYLLADIIQGIYTFSPESLERFEFVIVEPHENLRKIQQENFDSFFGDEISLLHLKSLKDAKFQNAIFISNELFDTFPCEVLNDEKMLYIDKNFTYKFKEASLEILEFAKEYGIKKGEIPLNFSTFLNQIHQSAKNFWFITFDYGYMGARNDISLRIYKEHKVYNLFEEIENLEEYYSKSDITYDLNFEILKGEFLKFKDVEFVDFKKQSTSLVDMGAGDVLEFIHQIAGEDAYKNATLQFKRLIYELGDRFCMCEFRRGKDEASS
ncbi:MAG: dihydrodipicolinate reductase [Campylobacter sp.]|nr:dihydrodipicolinate reductase [Campylobacter sp.]